MKPDQGESASGKMPLPLGHEFLSASDVTEAHYGHCSHPEDCHHRGKRLAWCHQSRAAHEPAPTFTPCSHERDGVECPKDDPAPAPTLTPQQAQDAKTMRTHFEPVPCEDDGPDPDYEAAPPEPARVERIEHEFVPCDRPNESCGGVFFDGLPLGTPRCHKFGCGRPESEHRSSAGEVGQTERIVAAAIRQDGVIYTGPHHHQIIRYVARLTGDTVTGEQGFVTTANRFVHRREALSIAKAAEQPLEHVGGGEYELFSEMLWSVPDHVFQGEHGATPEPPSEEPRGETPSIEAECVLWVQRIRRADWLDKSRQASALAEFVKSHADASAQEAVLERDKAIAAKVCGYCYHKRQTLDNGRPHLLRINDHGDLKEWAVKCKAVELGILEASE